VWGGHRGVGVASEGRLELRIAERVPERRHRLPDRVVEEHPAPGDAAVQLGGDEALLPLEVGGVAAQASSRASASSGATRKVLIRMTGPTSSDSWSATETRSSISLSCNIKASLSSLVGGGGVLT
jgi:hypothetical protein